MAMGTGMAVAVAMGLAVAMAAASGGPTCALPNAGKKDCGYSGMNQSQCEGKSCCWVPAEEEEGPLGDVPWCFYPSVTPTPPPVPTGVPFNASEVALMRSYFTANLNIEGKGGVVAAPDHNTPGGSYYYAWARDAALSMNAFLTTSDGGLDAVRPNMDAYVQWVLAMHGRSDPNNIDIRIEPKFELPNGEPYTGGWCRPQTDATGLRPLTLINYANMLLDAGDSDTVSKYLWTKDGSHNGGAIRHDLEWLMANWQSDSCDLWEEVRSSDFFWNRFNFKNALVRAGVLAMRLGDDDQGKKYNDTAEQISETLPAHYTGKYIMEETNRMIDGAVICALNDGYTAGWKADENFSPTSDWVASTIQQYNMAFHAEYKINSLDDAAGVPGILYGRYPGDHYAGGNPWILVTNCLGELYYRAAKEALTKDPSQLSNSKWREVLGMTEEEVSQPEQLAMRLAKEGDNVLNRVRYHVENDGFHLDEQLDRNTGFQASAKDLTWSYATVLKAMHRRAEFTQALRSVAPRSASAVTPNRALLADME